jgi:hypothetical protein
MTKGGPAKEPVLHTTGFMGLETDISALDLLHEAKRAGVSLPEDSLMHAAARQAISDTEAFKHILQQVYFRSSD